MKHTYKRMMITSILYLSLSMMIFIVSVFAWFTLTDVNNASLVNNISGVEAEYEFYVFKDSTHSGSTDLRLVENLCSPTNIDQCYEQIYDPTSLTFIDGLIAPGDRFSFALKIISVGSTRGYVDLSLGNIFSYGYSEIENKLQIAFTHEVTKVSKLIDYIESEDIKDQSPTIYQNGYFLSANNITYPLVTNVPLSREGMIQSATIVYFDFYFDPNIYGVDTEGMPYTNSNIFMNQTLQIKNIYMIIHP